mmetsp:Transcript_19128/g.33063  ORF Transcript_19128/g.33063 Transcript_19128/m.33063 type:complete len:220 (+) Transcript_19128:642-1301(+)
MKSIPGANAKQSPASIPTATKSIHSGRAPRDMLPNCGGKLILGYLSFSFCTNVGISIDWIAVSIFLARFLAISPMVPNAELTMTSWFAVSAFPCNLSFSLSFSIKSAWLLVLLLLLVLASDAKAPPVVLAFLPRCEFRAPKSPSPPDSFSSWLSSPSPSSSLLSSPSFFSSRRSLLAKPGSMIESKCLRNSAVTFCSRRRFFTSVMFAVFLLDNFFQGQ